MAESVSINKTLNLSEIKKDLPVIVHCRSGARSRAIVEALQANFNFQNLYNLKGGILAWANEIDHSIQTFLISSGSLLLEE